MLKKATGSSLLLAFSVVSAGLLLSWLAPIMPSQVQTVYGGAQEAITLEEAQEYSPLAMASTSSILPDEIDYAAAEDSFYANATLTPSGLVGAAQRVEVITYKIKDGDTLSSIGQEFNISLTTILNSNKDLKPTALSIGQEILILPTDGVLHKVSRGDTLAGLAIRYGVNPSVVMTANGINEEDVLNISQELVIPGGRPSESSTRTATSYSAGSLSSYMGQISSTAVYPLAQKGHQVAGQHGKYAAYDLAASSGTGIIVVESGIVEYVGYGWQGGYGNRVIVRHDNGRQTLYAHMSSIQVTPGQYVARGQIIGAVGSTGKSTGPHLHFEVR